MTRTCSLPECTLKHFGRGYCSTHYQRWLRHGDPYQVAFNRTTPGNGLEERFWSKVEVSPRCWIWSGKPSTSGYGVLRVNNKYLEAHRISYSLLIGHIPDHAIIDHKYSSYGCPRNCVNPNHLRVVDRKGNRENYSRTPKNNSSGYVGVYLLSDRNEWLARVKSNKKVVYRSTHPANELHVAAFYARIARAKYHNNNVIDKDD